MLLKRIDILKYKSIKESISIEINDDRVITLIGKNGSGKTNVLEAIRYTLSEYRRGYFSYDRNKTECLARYYIELTDEEVKDYSPYIRIEDKSKEIIVEFNGTNPQIRVVQATIIEMEFGDIKARLKKIVKNIQKSTCQYLQALKQIGIPDPDYHLRDYGFYMDLLVKGEGGFIGKIMERQINDIKMFIENQTKEMKEYIKKMFDGNKITIDSYDRPINCYVNTNPIKFYEIEESGKITINPILAKSLGINDKDLEEANKKLNKNIKEINNKLRNKSEEINSGLKEFNKITMDIVKTFEPKVDEFYDFWNERERKVRSFMDSMRVTIFNNCYYLDNENSLMFYNSYNRSDNYQEERKKEFYFNSRNPIIDAFDSFLHDSGELDDDKSLMQIEKWEQEKVDHTINVLNNDFLSSIVPKFDSKEIEKFEVQLDEGLKLYICEKNGERVLFNNTSLGRRWYLTYQFVKALLKKGDMLFIDEPAAFLHPQAQAEIKEELKKLAKEKGIYVFYSTHSPYMIPDNLGQVYNVTMTDEGSKVKRFSSGDDLCEVIKNDLGVINVANILFSLDKTILLVEGVTDKICIEKFAMVLNYKLDDYKILPCNGSPIFDVTYLCIQQDIKFKALFDLDNKLKPQNWMDKKYGYNEYIKIFETNENCVFTPEIRTKKSLEDCFHEKDNERYFSVWKNSVRKIDYKKIEGAIEFEEETKTNFEQLFNKLGIPKLDKTSE